MKKKANRYAPIIILLSIAIPLIIASLYLLPRNNETINQNLSKLPLISAILNGSTFILLLLAFRAIRKGKVKLHRKLIWICIILSTLFLFNYLTYHSLHGDTHYGGEGLIKYIYFGLLITHILLSVIIVPLVLLSLSRALTSRFKKHKKIARITLPIWLYVCLSGVLVYVMLLPYY